jgi:putative DNA primase/helicase
MIGYGRDYPEPPGWSLRSGADSEPHRGQARIAYRLAEMHRGSLMYVHGIGWHSYDGTRWVEDHRGEAKRAVLHTLRSALAESLDAQDLRADVRKCESAAGINGVLDIASALEHFAFTVKELDSDPYALNTRSGTVDLRTGETHRHTPSDRITKITRASVGSDVAGKNWGNFLASVLPDSEVRVFLQRFAGVGLVGMVHEHILAILTGTGANGKSVFNKALAHALGDYASTAEPDLFMHREGAHPTGEMDLRGVRWVTVSETDKHRRLAEATMKRLTGGDAIRARRMRQDFVEFEPSHSVTLVTNHLPKVSGDDPAIWRRLRVVPFGVVIPEVDRDPQLSRRLEHDADAILSWALAGYRDYQVNGLGQPEAVRAATDAYRVSSDTLSRFVGEECSLDANAHVGARELFGAWTTWCANAGEPAGGEREFIRAMEGRGHQKRSSNAGRRLAGLCLRVRSSGAGDE